MLITLGKRRVGGDRDKKKFGRNLNALNLSLVSVSAILVRCRIYPETVASHSLSGSRVAACYSQEDQGWSCTLRLRFVKTQDPMEHEENEVDDNAHIVNTQSTTVNSHLILMDN